MNTLHTTARAKLDQLVAERAQAWDMVIATSYANWAVLEYGAADRAVCAQIRRLKSAK